MPRLLRRREDGVQVTNTELFFDLVYVFAVTQLSHRLAAHLTWHGALHALVLFLAVWWAWNLTTWALNSADPDALPGRILVLVLMAISLVMSAAIPEAFEDRGWAFAIAYVVIQVGRGVFMVYANRGTIMGRNFGQLTAWSAIAGVAWIAGAATHGDTRLILWIVALALDVGSPMHSFWLPRVGGINMREWELEGAHLAERCQLIVLIALGESLLAVGATFTEAQGHPETALAFALGFAVTVALWALYFGRGHAEEAMRTISESDDATRIGRGGYAYAHAVMVAGIIVLAVAIEEIVLHPTGELHTPIAATLLGGPALFLIGTLAFHHAVGTPLPAAKLAGLAGLALCALLALIAGPLVLSAATLAVLAAVIWRLEPASPTVAAPH